MKKLVSSILILLALTTLSYAGSETLEKAQHRLPPVIYSIDIPKTVKPNHSYNFEWSVMGYHDSYDIIISVYKSNGIRIVNEVVSPNSTTTGQYRWGSIYSKKFSYSKSLSLDFSTSQEFTIRFFAKPTNDNIDDETYLSCIVPGGLGYGAGDTTGRKIKIYGIINNDRSHEVYLNTSGTSYLASPGGIERGWSMATGSQYHTGVDEYSDDWNWHSGSDDNGKEFYEVMGGKVIFTGPMYEDGVPIEDPDDAWLGNQIITYNKKTKLAVRYAHLSSILVKNVSEDCRSDLSKCQDVYVGQTIGKVGNTGKNVSAYHLHITLYKNIDTTELSNLRNGRWPQGNSISGGSNFKASFKYVGDK